MRSKCIQRTIKTNIFQRVKEEKKIGDNFKLVAIELSIWLLSYVAAGDVVALFCLRRTHNFFTYRSMAVKKAIQNGQPVKLNIKPSNKITYKAKWRSPTVCNTQVLHWMRKSFEISQTNEHNEYMKIKIKVADK